jgi:hypothetical protein
LEIETQTANSGNGNRKEENGIDSIGKLEVKPEFIALL